MGINADEVVDIVKVIDGQDSENLPVLNMEEVLNVLH